MKKKRLITMIGSVCLILVLAALLLPACAPKVVEAPELEAKIKALEGELTSEKAEVSKLEKELAELKKPAEVFEWRLGSIQVLGSVKWLTNVPFCEEVAEVSQGRLVITPYPQGVLAPAVDTTPAVQKGLYEMATAFLPYIKGVMLEANCTYLPFTWRSLDDLLLFYEREDRAFFNLFNKSFEEYGLKLLAVNPDSAVALMSTKPVESVKDLKGMKIRGSGPTADFMTELGASTVYIPGAEIYTALATGTIDAAMWGDEGSAYTVRLHEVARYLVRPRVITGSINAEVVVNPHAWDSLPQDLQIILQTVVDKYWVIVYKDEIVANDIAIAKMLEEGVTETHIPLEDYPLLVKAAESVWTKMANESPRSKEVVKMTTDDLRARGYTDYKID